LDVDVAPDGSPVALYLRLPERAAEAVLIHDLLPAGGTVLDLGCGTGRLAEPLARLGHPVTGVDNCPQMLAALRAAAGEPDGLTTGAVVGPAESGCAISDRTISVAGAETQVRLGAADDRVALRAFREDDLPFLDRLCTDPDALGEFEWPGFVDVRARRRRWEKDGYIGAESTALAVVLPDGTVAGIASWQPHNRGGSPGACYEIGLALLPEYRDRGLGTAAQRLLVRHLFGYTTAHRLEALTNTRNVAEQKVLERLGFHREGVLRGIVFGNGAWQDNVIYSLLRHEALGQETAG
jgi:RimJ/RimL family protein N-acetyltransferase